MIYLIYAAEQHYDGLHGMYDIDIIEVASEREADQYGEEMSYNVMNSYSGIVDTMWEEADESAALEGYNEEGPEREDYMQTYVEQLQEDNLEWIVYELSNEHTLDEYREMLEKNVYWKDIKDKYAIKRSE